MESIEPKRQATIIDVVAWESDAEFAVFPQGARAKDAVFSPADPEDPCLTPSKRYLFKRSKHSYPDQFWGEIVAYRVGCCMGLDVPHAFAAVNSGTGYSAALIEWFYDEPARFVYAGEFLQRVIPDFDRKTGKQHNLEDATLVLRLFAQHRLLTANWQQWLVDMLVFDSVIGNTDRHQDNWGFIFRDGVHHEGACMLAPLFDNGTSLGHERFTDRVRVWSDGDVDRYIARGRHHMGQTRIAGALSCGHTDLVAHALHMWPNTREIAQERLELLHRGLLHLLDDLLTLDGPVPFTLERARFIVRLLTRRLSLLRALIE